VLDALAKENRANYAGWLIYKAGSVDTVLEIEGDLVVECGLFFAGSIKVTGSISAQMILAGSGIEAR